jgi:hypothetical protein
LEAVSGPTAKRHRLRAVDRIVAAVLFVLLAAGSLLLWIGVPLFALWAVGQIVESPSQHLILGLAAVPVAMILWAPLLLWINALYLRVTGAALRTEDEEGGEMLRVRGPLDALLVWSFAIAAVALLVWIVFGSEGVAPLGPP